MRVAREFRAAARSCRCFRVDKFRVIWPLSAARSSHLSCFCSGGEAMIAFPWITLLTAVPIVGALVLLVLGGRNKNLARWSALAFSLAALVLTLVLWRHFDPASGSLQFQERHAWISALGVEYHVGIDGLGLLMLLLSLLWFRSGWLLRGRLRREFRSITLWCSFYRRVSSAPLPP